MFSSCATGPNGGAFGGFVESCVEVIMVVVYLGLSPIALPFHLSRVVFFFGSDGLELSFIAVSHLALMKSYELFSCM